MASSSLTSSDVIHTYTVQDFINFKLSDPITYYNLSILSASLDDPNLIYSTDNVLWDYIDELKDACLNVEMTAEEFRKYKYKPKLLAYDIYGATELFFIIMMLNGIHCLNIKEFTKKKLKLLTAANLVDLITKIYNAESNYISTNRSNLGLKEW